MARTTARTLIDSGSTGSCVDSGFVTRHGFAMHKAPVSVTVYNADGSVNECGKITDYVEARLAVGEHAERIHLGVVKLGNADIFLGHDWLSHHNPSIDWFQGTLHFDRCPGQCGFREEDLEKEEPKDGAQRWLASIVPNRPSWVEERVTQRYLDRFKGLFSEKGFDRLPKRCPWDHAIELKADFTPTNCKVYPLNMQERTALDEFLDENLRTGRIRPSKSPMASPFFFVKKKDGSLRPVQDYRKLNESTVKNRYPLPLIQELVDKLKGSRVFSKLDVRWGYNNIQIQPGDKWKAAFRTQQAYARMH